MTSEMGHLRHCKQAVVNCIFWIREQPFRPSPIRGNSRTAFVPLQNSSSVGEAMHVRSVITAEEARAGASSQGRMHMRSKCPGTAQSPAIQVNGSLLGWAAP
jgi:hypothetical protein